MYVFCFIDS